MNGAHLLCPNLRAALALPGSLDFEIHVVSTGDTPARCGQLPPNGTSDRESAHGASAAYLYEKYASRLVVRWPAADPETCMNNVRAMSHGLHRGALSNIDNDVFRSGSREKVSIDTHMWTTYYLCVGLAMT